MMDSHYTNAPFATLLPCLVHSRKPSLPESQLRPPMALIHTQPRPFNYPPHAPFLIHSRNQLQPHPPVPLPASLSPPAPPSSSITMKMAHAPPFNPQFSSPRSEAKESVRLPPLLPVAPTAMVQASFYHLSFTQPQPMPQVSTALLPRMLEFQRSAVVPDPVNQTYYFYQPPYLLAPAFSAVPSTLLPPAPAPLIYYGPAAAPPLGDRRATKVDADHQEDGEKPIKCASTGGARGSVASAVKAPRGVFFPTRRTRWVQRRCTAWSWVPKEEAERRRRLGCLNIRMSPGASCSSCELPSESTFFSSSFSSDSRPALPPSLELDESLAEQDTARTTLMMKNIPNKFRRGMLVKLLDDHCMEVNNKIEPADSPDGPPSEYDFVYLPMDFRTNSCLGYAFVNFTTPAAAWRFYQALNNYKWEMFGTKKITRICYARIQGKEAMLTNFGGSSFRCDSDEYLPVTFSPPRSGAAPCPPPTLVGKRWPRSTNAPRHKRAAAAGAPDISNSSFSSTARSSPKT